MLVVKTREGLQAWGTILAGRYPVLSIEVTRECPLRCPGCYAYEDGHLGGTNLRQLSDLQGEALISGVLALVSVPAVASVYCRWRSLGAIS